MNTFTWLLIGHLVGDWLLQNDWMAKGKKQGFITLPGLTHFAIYTVAVLGALRLSGVNDKGLGFYLILAVYIFVSHWLVDSTDIVDYWMRFYQQSNQLLVRVMVDQTFHIILLAVATYTVICRMA